MNGAKIYLRNPANQGLIPMTETACATEQHLQDFLASHPDLLPGDQINPEQPRRWLLVAREIGVPGDVGESGRWSLDHLFLDQDGVPTFVECKRSSDTRARREVVAQMLDYAANGLEYWTMDRLRQAAAETAAAAGHALDDRIRELTGSEEDEAFVDDFWARVEANLASGRVRLVFVADKTPRELRRLVEFLNDKLRDVEVLAVEIKQYQGADHTALVPRVVGLTESARSRKAAGGPAKPKTTQAEFLAACTPEAAHFFERVLQLAETRRHVVVWGTKGFAIKARMQPTGKLASFAYGWPEGRFEFYFAQLDQSEEEALALRQRLMDFGVFEPSGQKTLKAPVTPETIPQLNKVYEFILEEMEKNRSVAFRPTESTV